MNKYLTNHFFPLTKYKFYANQILDEKMGKWNSTTDDIFKYSKINRVDPYLILSIYYIENYYRPDWFVHVEYVLFRIGLLKNPSIGPFQIRVAHLKNKGRTNLTVDSLDFIKKLIKECKLNNESTTENFQNFGKEYNLDSKYGNVMEQIWLKVKKKPWVIKNNA